MESTVIIIFFPIQTARRKVIITPYLSLRKNSIENEEGAGSGIRARDFEIPQEARVNRITL